MDAAESAIASVTEVRITSDLQVISPPTFFFSASGLHIGVAKDDTTGVSRC